MLRYATVDDLEDLYRIEVLCFRERRFRRDHLEWILRNPKAQSVVEEDGGPIVGATMLLFEGGVCRVLSIAVLPEAQRKGIGTRLMSAAEQAARERRCGLIRLEVSTRNAGAIEFYRVLGYELDGFLPGYYSWGEDAYSMKKALAAHGPAEPPEASARGKE